MTRHQFLNILAFCILMGNEKILSKSPDYILEKFRRYGCDVRDTDDFMWGLDWQNRMTFDLYVSTWNNHIAIYDVPQTDTQEKEQGN